MQMPDDEEARRALDASAAPARVSRPLPNETRPLTVHLQVADLERSLQFYTGVIGLEVLDVGSGSAHLGVADRAIPIVSLVERRGARPIGPHTRLGLYHFAILLPSRASLGRCLLQLAEANLRVASADHWVSEALYLSDPDGLGIELYADRPRESWPREHGRVQMATVRLDLRALAASGRDLPWVGLPAGTTLGHVHLHVGEMEAARAFYGEEGLGFRTMFELPGALFVSAGGYHHHLGLNTWAEGAPSPDEDVARLIVWDLLVPGAAAADDATSRLTNAGHDVAREDGGWMARDPWGTALRVVTTTDDG